MLVCAGRRCVAVVLCATWLVAMGLLAGAAGGEAAAKKPAKVASAARSSGGCAAGMAYVPGGSFTTETASGASGNLCVDKTEVTLDAFRACVKAGKCEALSKKIQAPRLGLSERDAKKVSRRCVGGKKKGGGNLPVNCVDHDEAAQFCGFVGKRLPTDQEWEWAARGGTAGRAYPWGAQAPGKRACWNGRGNASGKGRRRGTCAVGKHKAGASVHGLLDLAGNVWEWTASESGDGFTIRGGGWSDENPDDLAATKRGLAQTRDRLDIVGFRCVKDAGGTAQASGPEAADAPDVERGESEVPLKQQITLPARPTPPYCVGASKECPPCMALLKGGSFRVGGKDGPMVTTPDYCMDLTEVTVARYGDCVDQGGCLWPVTQLCRSNPLALAHHPMNCVTWQYASTFCRAIGKELPTEAQWEWASRGGEEGRIFPWGNESPNNQLCWRRAKEEDVVEVEGGRDTKVVQLTMTDVKAGGTSVPGAAQAGEPGGPKPGSVDEGTCPVGSFIGGQSVHGLHDLAGNVWEWTRSLDPTDSRARILRGGSWENTDKIHVSAIGKLSLVSISASRKIGFRCVSAPLPPPVQVAPAATSPATSAIPAIPANSVMPAIPAEPPITVSPATPIIPITPVPVPAPAALPSPGK